MAKDFLREDKTPLVEESTRNGKLHLRWGCNFRRARHGGGNSDASGSTLVVLRLIAIIIFTYRMDQFGINYSRLFRRYRRKGITLSLASDSSASLLLIPYHRFLPQSFAGR